ncbi:CDP-alcohol phosphatidyltransferase family protein [Gordonibacter massiliensis (ex Traore et al. 2017)]|uniref:CDP-alcohol phosphatidyltransferase family protein n=1 Tax=Gordonibacter massiliensis (ex Traore et al. 2017) TaxID=1841863 RepID=A0A842JDP0_9ACTN|nr:CDP-alcohol phosphatidyltransferase family protein [Gordonibacter massiliensis (ex Traore et al. 2017)]MBC2889544.1 CDP-alcohol phosphatidyltransferase family protein [Gordonibacter massiliensis (ex Traore et al. 2017)]
MASKEGRGGQERGKENVSNRILTVPNVISLVRLCLVPVFLVLLFNGYDLMATFLFALAAGTDWVDGQIARRTNAVSRLGQLLDPAVDRILMIAGVAGLFLVGRLPLWIIVVVLVRDLALLVGGAAILKRYQVRVAVIYPGKVATTLLFVGFAALLLNWPVLNGLGVVNASWLPGLSADPYSWGIWFVYAGLVLALITTAYYAAAAFVKVRAAKRASTAQPERR